MTSPLPQDDSRADDLSEFLQLYLDETDEELETLVQELLKLEDDPRDENALNEAFRMLHSLKGSSGMMGYDGIAKLAHHLESRFDQFRSGAAVLDRATMDLMLDCVDFLREFSRQLRAGGVINQDGSALISRLQKLTATPTASEDNIPANGATRHPTADAAADTGTPGVITLGGGYRVRVTFQQGLQLADLKAKLIIARLSNIGEIVGSEPPLDDVQSYDELPQFVVIVATDRSPEDVREIANVDGVELIEILAGDESADETAQPESPLAEEFLQPSEASAVPSSAAEDDDQPHAAEFSGSAPSRAVEPSPVIEQPAAVSAVEQPPTATTTTALADSSRQRVAETVRVDIDRLDRLMNLTGELVVTNARFNQIAAKMSPSLRRAHGGGRLGDLSDRLRSTLDGIRDRALADDPAARGMLDELDDELAALQEQSDLWDEDRRHFSQITEAVDQLSRVSQNLQQGVLETRMVPVGPLFSRFRRVIRDLSHEHNKDVQLVIRGENTELDKRMIDELGDPLLHLIRNSIDHGLESPDQRRQSGKPAAGTIVLEASHSGNNVFVSIQDDGAGINVEKVRARIVKNGLADRDVVESMTRQQAIDHIWHPGFSTAEQVSDISGRGVGMDIVRSRIAELNGTIEVSTELGAGTTFHIRLPLTLAIIRSLMVRFRDGFFAIPVEDVQEIVSIPADQVYTVHGHQTIHVRGEFIPLTAMDKLFTWHNIDTSAAAENANADAGDANDNGNRANANSDRANESNNHGRPAVNVVILHSREKTLGLCVDELLGGADIVIKSLTDNFVSIRGLSGASIMGDGTVCLMLDTNSVFDMTADL